MKLKQYRVRQPTKKDPVVVYAPTATAALSDLFTELDWDHMEVGLFEQEARLYLAPNSPSAYAIATEVTE